MCVQWTLLITLDKYWHTYAILITYYLHICTGLLELEDNLDLSVTTPG